MPRMRAHSTCRRPAQQRVQRPSWRTLPRCRCPCAVRCEQPPHGHLAICIRIRICICFHLSAHRFLPPPHPPPPPPPPTPPRSCARPPLCRENDGGRVHAAGPLNLPRPQRAPPPTARVGRHIRRSDAPYRTSRLPLPLPLPLAPMHPFVAECLPAPICAELQR